MELSYNLQKTKAVLVGISEYRNYFTPIKPAKNNVASFKNILKDEEIFGLPEENIITLIDVDNNKIVDTIENIVENDDLDMFIFYYVGHGYRPLKNKLYLTASNSIEGLIKIKYSGIEYDDLKVLIEKAGKKRIVIIDACYSGIAAQGDNIALEESEKEINGTYVLTSAPRDEQSLFNTEEEYTFFTKELIETLNYGSSRVNDFFSLNDIYGLVEEKLRSSQKPEPQKKDNLNIKNEEFRFAKNKLFNKDNLISKAQKYYDIKDYKKVVEIIDVIKERYSTKNLDDIYEISKNEIEFNSKYSACLRAFEEHNFETASMIASEAIIIKEDNRNSELRRIIDECKRCIIVKNKLSNQYTKEIETLKKELLLSKKEISLLKRKEIKLNDKIAPKDSDFKMIISKLNAENERLENKMKSIELENKKLLTNQNTINSKEKIELEEQILDYEILIEELKKETPNLGKIRAKYDTLLKQIELKKKELNKLNSKFYFSSMSSSSPYKTQKSARKKT